MQTVTLTWNVTNWITVVLMALLGYALIGFLATGAKALFPPARGAMATVTGGEG